MVKLSATLSLVDGFTDKLNRVNSSLNRTGNAMQRFRESVGKITGKPFDPLARGAQDADRAVGNFSSGFAAKMGIISGVAQSVTSSAIGAISGGVKEMTGELNSASATWQTFQGNMDMIGKTPAQIKEVKGELQDFATKTIYSASDMASTYSQLAAVGIKDTTRLVKGFGGLAAAAEDPTQAMKTLSQQATQMAAKPMVQWGDFKLMLEQTPAGISQIAKTMGMSTAEMVKAVQDGKIKTEDFFKAISETGTNEKFTKMATTFKTVGQAMDGLKEGLANKLQPAFDKASQYGIKMVEKLSNSFDKMDFSKLEGMVDKFAPKLEAGIGKTVEFIKNAFTVAKNVVQDFMSGFASTDAMKSVGEAFNSIKDALSNIKSAMPKDTSFFKTLGELAGKGIGLVADIIKNIADAIAKMNPTQLQSLKNGLLLLGGAILGLKAANKVLPIIDSLKSLFSFGKGGSDPAKPLLSLKEGLNSLQKSAGIALIIASLALLAKAMEGIANAGANAPANMLSFAGAVAIMAAVLGGLGSKLQASALGIAVFAGSVSAMALSISGIANAGAQAVPNMITFGLVIAGLAATFALVGPALQSSALGIGVFALAISAMALSMSGIANAGAGAVANMTTFGLVVAGLAIVFAIFGPALTAASVGMLAFGATVLMVGAGLGMAAPFIAALPPVIMALGIAFSMAAMAIGAAVSQIIGSVSGLVAQIGNSVTQIANAIGTNLVNILKQAGDSISQVFDSIGQAADKIGGGIQKVLDGVANVISSIGTAALNAGQGFLLMASGIDMIMSHGVVSLGTHLGAVAIGLGKVAAQAGGLSSAGSGMQQISNAVQSGVGAINAFVAGLGAVSAVATQAAASASILKAAFSNITIPAPNTSAFVAGLATMVAAARAVIPQLMSAGQQGGTAFVTGLSSARGQAVSAMIGIISAAAGAARSGVGQFQSIGAMIGQGLAVGLQSAYGAVAAAASALVAKANEAAKAKAQIHSPSRLFRDEVGWFMGAGLARGMDNSASLVADSSAGLVNTAVTSSDVPSQGLTQVGVPNQTAGNQTKQTIIEVGGITIQSTGNEEYDAEALLEAFENLLVQKQNAGLAY